MNNFIYKLAAHIKKLETGYPVQIGKFLDGESLVIIPTEASTMILEYLDGTKEIRLSFSIGIKAKSQEKAVNTLSDAIKSLTQINSCLKKENLPCILLNIAVEQKPHFAEVQEIGYFIYQAKIIVDVAEIK